MNSYNWDIKPSQQGAFVLTTNGVLAGVFRTREEAVAFTKQLLNRDLVERQAREWIARELKQKIQKWSEDLGLPMHEILEDAKAGIDEGLLDLLSELG
jgi:hypothetical protein